MTCSRFRSCLLSKSTFIFLLHPAALTSTNISNQLVFFITVQYCFHRLTTPLIFRNLPLLLPDVLPWSPSLLCPRADTVLSRLAANVIHAYAVFCKLSFFWCLLLVLFKRYLFSTLAPQGASVLGLQRWELLLRVSGQILLVLLFVVASQQRGPGRRVTLQALTLPDLTAPVLLTIGRRRVMYLLPVQACTTWSPMWSSTVTLAATKLSGISIIESAFRTLQWVLLIERRLLVATVGCRDRGALLYRVILLRLLLRQ